MKKTVFIALSLGAVMVLTGCKSRESLYRQAYEEAKAQEMEQSKQQAAQNTQVVEVKPATQQEPKVVPITGNPLAWWWAVSLPRPTLPDLHSD